MVVPAIASPYTYVGGDPVNNVDPTGKYKVTDDRPLPRRWLRRSSPPAIQFDCGWFSCTIRFNRATTQTIANGGFTAATLAAACGQAFPWAAPLCAPLALAAIAIYLSGNCLGIKIWPMFLTTVPVVVGRDTYNCG